MTKTGKRRLHPGRRGSVLLSAVWFLLILSGMLISAGYPLELQRTLVSGYRKEQEIREKSRELLQVVIHRLQNDESEYDAPGTMDFPPGFLEEMGYPGAVIELWDEGSRLNLNNTSVLTWDIFFQDEPEFRRLVHNWFFQRGGLFETGSTLLRQNYLLCREELRAISSDETFYQTFAPEITVFGPANFYLLEGETFLSLLYRAGESYSTTTEMAIITAFNQKRLDTMYQADLATLISRLELPVIIDVEKLRPLVTTEGFLNPNFISPRFLNAIWGSSLDDLDKIRDLRHRQAENPFTTKEAFELYIQEAYGYKIPINRTWLMFSLKTKIWGVKITFAPEDGTGFELSAILQREREDEYSRWQVKILSYQEKWL